MQINCYCYCYQAGSRTSLVRNVERPTHSSWATTPHKSITSEVTGYFHIRIVVKVAYSTVALYW